MNPQFLALGWFLASAFPEVKTDEDAYPGAAAPSTRGLILCEPVHDRPWRRWSLARGHGLELLQRVADQAREIRLVGLADPASERDLEGADTDLGGQDRGRVGDAG
ncbi:hypothetical protein ACFCYH_40360 [Streptomyces sp. NPDC056400]|uniref:hypothetical protein n=1 Tax=Streptomyces sp. NPDC056400 TaxID=3345808 RepID=UPI0035D7B68B